MGRGLEREMESSLSREAMGRRIREIRGKRTQKEFAELMEATQAYISDLERGKSYPSVPFIAHLAEVSGRSYNWLFTGEEEMTQLEEEAGPEEEARPQEVAVDHVASQPPQGPMVDTGYVKVLLSLMDKAPYTEKRRFLKIIVSYLMTFL